MAKNTAASSLTDAQMTPEGLCFKGVILEQIVEKCEGCERVVVLEAGKYCPSYAKPASKWVHGLCNFATHMKGEKSKTGDIKINPLKASKRAARGR
jgi:hypothetical protein